MPGGINDLNKGLGFGLNARGSSAAAGPSRKSKKPKKPKKGKSVFDDDDGSSSDESSSGAANAGVDGRSSVNAEIAQEQAALRRRAEAAMKAAAADTVYNYDDGFEEFSTSEKAKKEAARKQQQDQPERKARYISTLLQTANKRKQAGAGCCARTARRQGAGSRGAVQRGRVCREGEVCDQELQAQVGRERRMAPRGTDEGGRGEAG